MAGLASMGAARSKTGIRIVNGPSFMAACDMAARAWGKRAGDLVTDEMRLWAEDLMADRKFNVPQNRKQGKNAIAADIVATWHGGATGRLGGLVYGIDQRKYKIFQAGPRVGFRNKQTFRTWFVQANKWLPDGNMQTLLAWRDRNRNRVGRISRSVVRSGDPMIVPKSRLAAFLRELTNRVGRARKGWIAACSKWNAKAPAWLQRAAPHKPNESRCGGQMRPDGSGSLWIVNRVPYASQVFRFYLRYTGDRRLRHLIGMLRAAQKQVGQQFSMRKVA